LKVPPGAVSRRRRRRGLPQAGSGAIIDGGTLAEWFDVIVHTQTVSAATVGSPPG
jgi:hypothetical protein